MSTQAIIFDNHIWMPMAAIRWLRKNGFKPIKKVHKTKNYLRYRIAEPEGKYYKTIQVDDGVLMVLQYV